MCLSSDSVSEGDYSPVVTGSSVHTDLSGSQQPDIPSTDQPGSVSELPSTQHSPSIYTQDLDSPSVSKRVRPCACCDVMLSITTVEIH